MPEEKKYPPKIFVEGIYFFKPNEKAPSWIKGNLSINFLAFKEFIKKQDFKEPIMRIDLNKSDKTGKYYFTLNTYKKPATESPTEALNDF
jgi:hypothetical protein